MSAVFFAKYEIKIIFQYLKRAASNRKELSKYQSYEQP